MDFAVKKKKLKDRTMGLLLMALCSLFAQENWAESTGFDEDGLWLTEQPEFLPVDDAFQFSLETGGDGNYSLLFQIEDGYYLYKDQFDAWTFRDGARARVRGPRSKSKGGSAPECAGLMATAGRPRALARARARTRECARASASDRNGAEQRGQHLTFAAFRACAVRHCPVADVPHARAARLGARNT